MKNTGLGLILTMLLAATVASAADLDALTNDESSRVREKAAWVLGRIGVDAKPALDELKKASTSDKSKRVKGRCLESLTRIKKDLAGKDK
ncbi:MAG: HEAT repeat domain-containing protein [Planctomycetota bacterium]